jgi:hypothetical protein
MALKTYQLAAADAAMSRAKAQFSVAVLAALRRAPDAVQKTRAALQAVEDARGKLRRLGAQQLVTTESAESKE